MDKQRLLELAGITEARLAGADNVHVVVEVVDGGVEAWGPFGNATQATAYQDALIENHNLDPQTLRVVRVMLPENV